MKNEHIQDKIVPGLREHVDSLLSRDQEFRFDYDNKRDTIRIIDSMILQDVIEIFDTYGFPNDEVIGIEMRNDSTIKGGWSAFDILLIHQIKNNRTEFVPVLEKFLAQGQMSRGSFMSHSKNFVPTPNFRLSCLQSVQALLVQVKDELFTCCCVDEILIDKNRRNYYLEPLSDLRKKVEFNYEVDSRFRFKSHAVNYDTSKGDDGFLKIREELVEEGFILYKKISGEKPYYQRRPK